MRKKATGIIFAGLVLLAILWFNPSMLGSYQLLGMIALAGVIVLVVVIMFLFRENM